jgi:N utilization substance protein B
MSAPVPSQSQGAHLLRRSAARLGVVQLLFQYEQQKASPAAIPAMVEGLSLQLLENQQEADEEALSYEPDTVFLRTLAEGVITHLETIDAAITPHLSAKWRYERIDPVLRALLRAATYELAHTPTPANVVINEYVDVAAAFGSEEETAFVNGLLDAVAKGIKPVV